MAVSYSQTCIGLLEHNLHEEFAKLRISSSFSPYIPYSSIYHKIDEYVDERYIDEVKDPLIINGKTGSGL